MSRSYLADCPQWMRRGESPRRYGRTPSTSPVLPTLLRETFPSICTSPRTGGTGPTGYVLGQTMSVDSAVIGREASQSPNGKPVARRGGVSGYTPRCGGVNCRRNWTVRRPGTAASPATGSPPSSKPFRSITPQTGHGRPFRKLTRNSTASSSDACARGRTPPMRRFPEAKHAARQYRRPSRSPGIHTARILAHTGRSRTTAPRRRRRAKRRGECTGSVEPARLRWEEVVFGQCAEPGPMRRRLNCSHIGLQVDVQTTDENIAIHRDIKLLYFLITCMAKYNKKMSNRGEVVIREDWGNTECVGTRLVD